MLLAIASPHVPPIPVDHLVAEGHALAKVATKHDKELRRTGLDAKLLASIGLRATALSDAQSEVTLRRRAKRTAGELELERAGVELRSELVADGRFALRDDADAQATIDRIQEGEGLDDLVQDLRELSKLAKKYKALLSKVGVKVDAKSKSADKLASALEDVVAHRRAGDGDERRAIDLRDRAATTYLVDAMREARAAGTYAFRKQPEIAGRFRGVYVAHKRARAKGKPQPEPVAPTAGNGQASPRA